MCILTQCRQIHLTNNSALHKTITSYRLFSQKCKNSPHNLTLLNIKDHRAEFWVQILFRSASEHMTCLIRTSTAGQLLQLGLITAEQNKQYLKIFSPYDWFLSDGEIAKLHGSLSFVINNKRQRNIFCLLSFAYENLFLWKHMYVIYNFWQL